MTEIDCIQKIKKAYIPSTKLWNLKDLILLKDNDPKHVAKKTKDFF